jgi:hypothetical protein
VVLTHHQSPKIHLVGEGLDGGRKEDSCEGVDGIRKEDRGNN